MKNLLFAALLALSTAAFGEGSNFYLAADGGRTTYKDFCSGAPSGACSNSGNALRIAGGYSLAPLFALEASYDRLGKATFNSPFGASLGYKATAVQFSGVGAIPVSDRFSALLKVGLVHSMVTVDTPLANRTAKASKNSLGFGVGGQFNLTRHAGVRVQYEDLGSFSYAFGAAIKVQLVSAGFVYRF